MQIITILEVLAIFITTLYLLNHYAAKDVPLYVKILVFIGWFSSFVNIVLVPLDVYYVITLSLFNFLIFFRLLRKMKIQSNRLMTITDILTPWKSLGILYIGQVSSLLGKKGFLDIFNNKGLYYQSYRNT